jgi:hypothetical protein
MYFQETAILGIATSLTPQIPLQKYLDCPEKKFVTFNIFENCILKTKA